MLGLLLSSGCDKFSTKKRPVKEDDILLASVEDKDMYFSDIESMISAIDQQDSLAQLNALIEAWLARNVVLKEAEKKFPSDIDIDKLIEDYRSSLLLHNYRQSFIQKDLDTIITAAQEKAYYESNKDQYLIAEPICQARIVKIPDNKRRLERFNRNWKKNNTEAVEKYVKENAAYDSSEDQNWYSVNHFLSFLPDDKFSQKDFIKKGHVQKHSDSIEYFIRVIDVRKKNEIPPLSYIRDQMRKVMIHQRKKALLEKLEKDLYQNYLKSNKIKVYNK